MIISQLSGGLGNQLFQYAFGFARAKALGVEFKLDLSFYEDYDWHDYSLGPFNISSQIANDEEKKKILDLDSKLIQRIKRKYFFSNYHCIHEHSLLYNSSYLKLQKSSYIVGYWQCEKYFKDVWPMLHKEFEITIPPNEQNQAFINKINSEISSISLHIRRGNYVTIDSVNQMHGTINLEYYQGAIEFFGSRFDRPAFFVFSDDIHWAKQNLNIEYPVTFVDVNDDQTDYEDLRLMSLCKHNIIANSTFSWWGAYLNKNYDKIVIAPNNWFADPLKNLEAKNIIPQEWKRLG
jgi:hypothetical protein